MHLFSGEGRSNVAGDWRDGCEGASEQLIDRAEPESGKGTEELITFGTDAERKHLPRLQFSLGAFLQRRKPGIWKSGSDNPIPGL